MRIIGSITPILSSASGIRPENASRTMQGHTIPGGMSGESVGIGTTDSSRLVSSRSRVLRIQCLVEVSFSCRENDRVPATDSEHSVGWEGSRLVAATSLATVHSLASAGCIMCAVGDNTTAAKCTTRIPVAKRVVPRRDNVLILHGTMSRLALS